ncbi:TetR family transcriptional regulator [Speluncibacter jeojiensis]
MEVARVAALLFFERGYDNTTVEELAHAAGIGMRTFYRYFSGKEDAIAPLLSTGTDAWAQELVRCAPELPLIDALVESYSAALARVGEYSLELDELRPALRAAIELPALRAMWTRVQRDTEEKLVGALAERLRMPADDVRVRLAACMANSSARVAVEAWAQADDGGSPADKVRDCLSEMAAGGLLAAPAPPLPPQEGTRDDGDASNPATA